MSLALTTTQRNQINTYGTAKQYAQMYAYIAEEMKAGRIVGASTEQTYWFEQASKINANDTSSPASVYIQRTTGSGLAFCLIPT